MSAPRTPNSCTPDSRVVRRWAGAVLLSVAVLLSLTVIRVAHLKTFPPEELDGTLGSRTSTTRELAPRGRILDRRGRVLATTTVGHKLFADPALIWERGWKRVREGMKRDPEAVVTTDPFEDVAEALGQVIDQSPAAIRQRLRDKAESRYLVLDTELSDHELDGVRTLGLEGIGTEQKLVRHYPHAPVASQLVGRTNIDQHGLSGLELMQERALAPTTGKLTFLRDARRNALHIDEDAYVPPRPGRDVRLTIDLVIQEIAERRLAKAVQQYNAGGGRIVVVDPHTGDVLAMADILRKRPGWAEVTEDKDRARDPALGRNRCVTDAYEPGSTFKPFVWATATELGIFSPTTKLATPGSGPYRTAFGRLIRDVHYYGSVDWKTVLVKSLNSGMAMAGERMSFDQMRDGVVDRFGFGQRTGAGLPGEEEGLLTPARQWTKWTQTSVAMGHEIGVTPAQMARAFSAFCTDGSMPRLRMVLPPDSEGSPSAPPRTPVLPEPIALMTREAMERVLSEGTGRKAQSATYRMFGKSGTAQLPKPKGQGRGYFEDRYVSSFIAGAPLEHPRVVVLCVIDDPDRRKGHFGGSIAGPVVRDVIDETLNYLGVRPDQLEDRRKQILATGQDLPENAAARVATVLMLNDDDVAAEITR
jgi:cell division protein FtsI (penicillin-binding protein 3)